MGYIKKIAVIKQLKGGFSADGGTLSGIVKAETYAGFLKVETSLLNFAPLSEGRYLTGITDGVNCVLFEECSFEGETPFDLTFGFASIVSFCVNGTISPVASAVSGQMAHALPALKLFMERAEGAKKGKNKDDKKGDGKAAIYDDEAIAESNYYEYKTDEDGGAVCQADQKEEDGRAACKDEEGARTVSGDQNPVGDKGEGRKPPFEECRECAHFNGEGKDGEPVPCEREDVGRGGVADDGKKGGGAERGVEMPHEQGGDGVEQIKLADGDFYSRMEDEIENIFSRYPPEEKLMKAMSGSRWAKIGYGDGKYYVFGVLYREGEAAYVCYGVPSSDGQNAPKSLSGYATYMPVEGGGFWIMYQDARTGVSVKISVS